MSSMHFRPMEVVKCGGGQCGDERMFVVIEPRMREIYAKAFVVPAGAEAAPLIEAAKLAVLDRMAHRQTVREGCSWEEAL